MQRLREDEQANAETRVLPFYCDFNLPEKKNPRYIIGSLLRQLAPSPPLDPESLRWKQLQELYNSNHDKKQVLPQLTAPLIWFSKFFSKIFIVVDGLDECSTPTDVCSVLLKCLRANNINVLATSRPERDIATLFRSKQEVRELEIQDKSVESDIGVYIDWRLSRDDNLKSIKKQLKQDIRAKLLDESSGMYYFQISH